METCPWYCFDLIHKRLLPIFIKEICHRLSLDGLGFDMKGRLDHMVCQLKSAGVFLTVVDENEPYFYSKYQMEEVVSHVSTPYIIYRCT